MAAGMAIHPAMGVVMLPPAYKFAFYLFLVANHSVVPVASSASPA